jgi:hypothetical protein
MRKGKHLLVKTTKDQKEKEAERETVIIANGHIRARRVNEHSVDGLVGDAIHVGEVDTSEVRATRGNEIAASLVGDLREKRRKEENTGSERKK